MRSRWEGGADEDLDAPATISERELKALRRRAGFGILAVFLATVAIVGLAWTLYAGPEGLERVQDVKDRVLSGGAQKSETVSQAEPAAQAAMDQPTDSTQMRPLAADSTAASVPPAGVSNGGPDTRSTQGPARAQGTTGP
jgi:hypothetical protein